MCGKFAAGHLTQRQMAEIIEGYVYPSKPRPDKGVETAQWGYNIKPTNQVPCLTAEPDGLHMTSARWWFVPHWHKGDVKDWKATTFNAKIETAFEKPTFRNSWANQRCLIPAVAYYEWTGPKGAKQPWAIKPQINASHFFFAGLYSDLGDGLKTCTILTRAAEEQLTDIHPRTPVILRESQGADFLHRTVDDDEVIESYGTGWNFDAYKVDKIGVHDDGPELLDPQRSLF